jgi:iron complex outermembrane receptor protein
VTTASRKEEKALSAPASVSVVELREIQEKPAPTVADQLKGVAGVDINKGGVAQSNIVARGFNNAFSGSMLMLQDYRFAGVPSLRVNVPFLFTGTSEDVERVEVLLGPASALYGPNSANGVLHVITKSPFTQQGTTLTIDGGTQSLLRGSARHSRLFGEKVGVKLSGEFFTAEDFEYHDPAEPATVRRPVGGGQSAMLPNVRDFDVRRTSGEARVDVRPGADAELVTTVGMSRIQNALELTGANGTAQARGWTYVNLQQRARFGRLFGQAFLNMSDAGNEDSLDASGTFLLRSGQPIVDKSRVFVGQLQHGRNFGLKQDFVYGVDYIRTMPNTGNTINGRNEDDDDVTEIGGYVQSTTNLTEKLDLVAALRADQNNRIEGTQVSPRAALIYKPNTENNFRVTYNRAFGTPANFTMFLDLIQLRNVSGSPYSIRAVGNPPKDGWQFNRGCVATVSDGLCMKSIFLGPQANTFVPATASAALPGLVAAQASAITAAFTPQIQALLVSQGVPANQAAQQAPVLAGQLVAFLGTLRPNPTQVGTRIARINEPTTANRDATSVTNIDPLAASYNTTYELGYKGIIGGRMRVALDLWHQIRGDVGNPADIVTPSVYADSTTLANYLTGALTPALQQQGLSQPVAAAAASNIGRSLAQNFKGVPLGLITFDDERFATPTDVYATYQTVYQEVSLNGADLAVDYVANDQWTLGGTFSWVSKLIFEGTISSNNKPLMLNAPDNKGSLFAKYRDLSGRWGGEIRGRYFSAYPVNSGVYATDHVFLPGTPAAYSYEPVEGATLLDMSLNYRLPVGARELLLSVNADNLLGEKYRTFPGTPELGRMVVTRLQITF